MDLQTVSVELVDRDPNQPRQSLDELDLKRLALSIRERGLLQPPIVFGSNGRYQIVDGHCRFAALRLLGIKEVDALVLATKPTAETLLETQLTANCLRQDMTPMDKARAFERLKQLRGWSNVDLATALHISKATVTQCLSYLTLPTEVQADLDAGTLAGSTAYAIARASDEQTRQEMLTAAKKGELSRDAAAKRVRTREESTGRPMRMTCRLPGITVTVISDRRVTLGDVAILWRDLARETKRAQQQKLDVATFERVLADRSRIESD